MKQVININFQGSIIPIEISAYEILKNYIASLTTHFSAEEGKDEIINDIESRIAELFQVRLKAGATCIQDADVQAVMNSIGRPEDLAGEGDDTSASKTNEQKKTNTTYNAAGKRRLFRDENHKLVGGVCSGVANYFDIDIAIVRVVFLILLFSFGFGLLPYIILWIAVPSSAEQVIGSRRKKLYRDLDEKYVGGVASGIANYFGINVWIPRVFFLLPLVTFFSRNSWNHYGDFNDFDFINLSPSPLFIYIILWIVLPEAKTTAEKLEMKGEKVDMNSIKESVVEEMKGVQQRVQKFGNEVTTVATEKGKVFGKEAASVGKRGGSALGEIISIIVKVFVFGILGIVGLFLLLAMFGIGIGSLKYFPIKDFIVRSGLQNTFAWGTLIFFILVPIIGVITWIIRKITKVKTGSKMLRLSFLAMWVIGWVSLFLMCNALSKDFKKTSELKVDDVALINPAVKSLEIVTPKSNNRNRNNWTDRDFFEFSGDDEKLTANNIIVEIQKAANDSFKVTTEKFADGSKIEYADTLARQINFNVQQKDTMLTVDRGIEITTKNKFRNQHVVLTVYVPIGKRIKVQNGIGNYSRIHFNSFGITVNDRRDYRTNDGETGWDSGEWYTMTKDGLVSDNVKEAVNDEDDDQEIKINKNGIDIKDGKKRVTIDEDGIREENNTENTGTYRYDSNKPNSKKDSIKINLEKVQKKFNDSIQKEKDKIDKQNETVAKNESTLLLNVLPTNLLAKYL